MILLVLDDTSMWIYLDGANVTGYNNLVYEVEFFILFIIHLCLAIVDTTRLSSVIQLVRKGEMIILTLGSFCVIHVNTLIPVSYTKKNLIHALSSIA